MKKILKSKKGAAIVVVLIAITFISIIASSLLYMSYINLMTKQSRIHSSDNFYLDELAVAEIATGIQTIAKQGSTPDEAIEKLDVLRESPGGVPTGYYSCSALADLINVASAEATVKVTTSQKGVTNRLEVSGEKVTFKDVVIITEDTARGFKDRIETDISFDMRTTVNDGPDINDFSLISDATVTTTTGNQYGGSLVLTGNVYCRAKGSDPAMNLISGRVVSMLSPLAAIDGDLVIEDHAALIITGSCVVDGNIEIGNDSSLIITGFLGCTGTIDGNTDPNNFPESTKLKVKNSGKIEIDADKYDLPDTGMASELFSKNILVNFKGRVIDLGVACKLHTTGYTEPIDYLLDDAKHYKCFDTEKYNVYCLDEKQATNVADAYKEVNYGAWVDDSSDTINADEDHYGKLYLTGNDYQSGAIADPNRVQLKEQLYGTTVLALRDIYFTETHYTKIDKMPDDAYLRAQECMLQIDRQLYVGSSEQTTVHFNGGSSDNVNVESLKDAMRQIKSDPSLGTIYEYTVARPGTSAPTAPPTGGDLGAPEIAYNDVTSVITDDEIENLRVDAPKRYLVSFNDASKADVSLIPVGYLLSPYSKETIAKYFSAVYNANAEVSPVLNFEHWDKSNSYNNAQDNL